MGKTRLGDVLVSDGTISDRELRLALTEQRTGGGKIGEALIGLGLTDERTVTRALAKQSGVDFIDVDQFPIQAEAVRRVPLKVMKAHSVVPLLVVNGELLVATLPGNPSRTSAHVAFVTGLRVRSAIGTPSAIKAAIAAFETALAKASDRRLSETEIAVDY